jgi:hypothetical protein
MNEIVMIGQSSVQPSRIQRLLFWLSSQKSHPELPSFGKNE